MTTVRLSTASALVRWMTAQRSQLLDGTEVPLFAGVFAIFGHGNVLGLGTALAERRGQLPTWRGHTEEGMALAAVGYARATDRRQVMAATSSIGPGALNMVTAAGVAHADRLPVLLLPGDTFTGRAPDPVLQQVEHFGDPTVTVNDAFRPVARYFDRITRPEQLMATLPQVARVLTDPADTGPVVLALPQDVQVERFDFPVRMFDPCWQLVPRPRADELSLDAAARLLRQARRPLIVVGGGVRYSGAGDLVRAFAGEHGVPIVDTVAGRTLIPHDDPHYGGPLGVAGSTAANRSARAADVVLVLGSRLQDFTTSSWSGFDPHVRLVLVNAARFDAVKHNALAVTADIATAMADLTNRLSGWRADSGWLNRAVMARQDWDAHVSDLRRGATGCTRLTYAQVVGAVNDVSLPGDYVVGASGGLPGELHGGWRAAVPPPGPTSGAAMDLEYGFSCMGYEIAGAWGAALARARTHPGSIVTSIVGDGSYLMLNSELYAAAFAGTPLVVVVCDNEGYAVIHRLQTGQGAEGFNNLLTDCAGPGAARDGVRVDFAAHARALGCRVEELPERTDPQALADALRRARYAATAHRVPAVVVVRVSDSEWTQAEAWWEVGVPEELPGRADYESAKQSQVRWAGGR